MLGSLKNWVQYGTFTAPEERAVGEVKGIWDGKRASEGVLSSSPEADEFEKEFGASSLAPEPVNVAGTVDLQKPFSDLSPRLKPAEEAPIQAAGGPAPAMPDGAAEATEIDIVAAEAAPEPAAVPAPAAEMVIGEPALEGGAADPSVQGLEQPAIELQLGGFDLEQEPVSAELPQLEPVSAAAPVAEVSPAVVTQLEAEPAHRDNGAKQLLTELDEAIKLFDDRLDELRSLKVKTGEELEREKAGTAEKYEAAKADADRRETQIRADLEGAQRDAAEAEGKLADLRNEIEEQAKAAAHRAEEEYRLKTEKLKGYEERYNSGRGKAEMERSQVEQAGKILEQASGEVPNLTKVEELVV